MKGQRFIPIQEVLLQFDDLVNLNRTDKEQFLLEEAKRTILQIAPLNALIPNKEEILISDYRIALPANHEAIIGVQHNDGTRMAIAYNGNSISGQNYLYEIRGNYIYFGITNQKIFLYYYGLPYNDNGIYFMPNDQNLIEAIHYKLIFKLLIGVS